MVSLLSILDGMTEITPLINQLESAVTTESIILALQALGASGHPDVLPHLIKAFSYNRPAVSDVALAEVLKFGTTAVSTLLTTIDDYDYGARAYSMRALSQLQDPRAWDCLFKSIQEDFAPGVRRAATKGIGRIASQCQVSQQQETVTLLKACLSEADWGVRYAATCALKDLKDYGNLSVQPESQAALEQATKDPDPLIQYKSMMSLNHKSA